VQVNLFLDCDADGKPDQPLNDGTGLCTSSLSSTGYQYDAPDVDNYPFCWRDPEFAAGNPALCPTGQARGPEDIKRSATAVPRSASATCSTGARQGRPWA